MIYCKSCDEHVNRMDIQPGRKTRISSKSLKKRVILFINLIFNIPNIINGFLQKVF